MAFASISCTCKKCGKKFEVRREFHSRKEADSWVDWAGDDYYDLCPTCYKEGQQAKAAAELADLNASHKMPALTGSPKQIAWADKIRKGFIRDWDSYVAQVRKQYQDAGYDPDETNAAYEQVLGFIRAITKAAQWIDLRDAVPLTWINDRLMEAQAAAAGGSDK